MVPQDLHIHTVYSYGDSAIVRQQTIDLIKRVHHAETIGISDHFEYLLEEETFERYESEVRSAGFRVGIEVSGQRQVEEAVKRSNDYFVYHCFPTGDYMALEKLIASGKPVIIAHPLILGTDLDKIPVECYIEINNRYIS